MGVYIEPEGNFLITWKSLGLPNQWGPGGSGGETGKKRGILEDWEPRTEAQILKQEEAGVSHCTPLHSPPRKGCLICWAWVRCVSLIMLRQGRGWSGHHSSYRRQWTPTPNTNAHKRRGCFPKGGSSEVGGWVEKKTKAYTPMPTWEAASSLQVTTHLILILAPQSKLFFSSVFKK